MHDRDAMLKGATDILGARLAEALARVAELEARVIEEVRLAGLAAESAMKSSARVAELEAKLLPFARLADAYDPPAGYSPAPDHAPIDPRDEAHHRGALGLTVGDLRQARAVLAKGRAG